MAEWESMGSFKEPPIKKEWRWEQRRALLPFTQCDNSYKFLFMKKAYRGRLYFGDEWVTEKWLSAEEYLWQQMKE